MIKYRNAADMPQSYWDMREVKAIRKGYWEEGKRGPELDAAVKTYFEKREQDRLAIEAKCARS